MSGLEKLKPKLEIILKTTLAIGLLGFISILTNNWYSNDINNVEKVRLEECWDTQSPYSTDPPEQPSPNLPKFVEKFEATQTENRESEIQELSREQLLNSNIEIDQDYYDSVIWLAANWSEQVDFQYLNHEIWQMSGLVVGAEMINNTPTWIILTANHGFTGYPLNLSDYFNQGSGVNISFFSPDYSNQITKLAWSGNGGRISSCQKLILDNQYAATLLKITGTTGVNPFHENNSDSPLPYPITKLGGPCNLTQEWTSIGFPDDGNNSMMNGPVETIWVGPVFGVNGDWGFGSSWWGLPPNSRYLIRQVSASNYGDSGSSVSDDNGVCGITNISFSFSSPLGGETIYVGGAESLPSTDLMAIIISQLLYSE